MIKRVWLCCLSVWFVMAGAAYSAGLWQVFVERCLDPYEHHALAIHAPLTAHPQDSMHDAKTVFGPTVEGYLMSLDAAPSEGERACAMYVAAAESAALTGFHNWRSDALAQRRYEEISQDVFLSVEWSEPRLRLRVKFDESGTFFEIVETNLES